MKMQHEKRRRAIADKILRQGRPLLFEAYGNKVKAEYKPNLQAIVLRGVLSTWDEVVDACKIVARKYSEVHVVNDIICLEKISSEIKDEAVHFKEHKDAQTVAEQVNCDVLVIGGGISGATIAREMCKYNVDVVLVEKEYDLGIHGSGRNDGEIHPGVDLGRGSLKQKYVVRGNLMYPQFCKELAVKFQRCGQLVGFFSYGEKPLLKGFAAQRRIYCGVGDTQIVPRRKLREIEPYFNAKAVFGLYNSSAGRVASYELAIACGENFVENGGSVLLGTKVIGIECENQRISQVRCSRQDGTLLNLKPKIVINCAGVYAEEIARLAGDRFYSIHPRKGTIILMDRKSSFQVAGITSWKAVLSGDRGGNSKGGGIIHTVADTLLIGPDAEETWKKEDFSTDRSRIEAIITKQKKAIPSLEKKDIITYFAGVRAPTFEEDYIIECGRQVENLIHCAGIQSPGLTTAPAVAEDVVKMAVEILENQGEKPEVNSSFNPYRRKTKVLREMSLEQRNQLIQENGDYGKIVCRCESISKGEILDALRSPLPVYTVDAVKRRVRAGMGRCQGGFCLPLIMEIISEELGIDVTDVCKGPQGTEIAPFKIKEQSRKPRLG